MEKLLFFDIETHRVKNWNELPLVSQKAFRNHIYDKFEYKDIEECYREKAGLNAEFSQVICVSMGYEWENDFKLTSIHDFNEVEILTQLSPIFNKFQEKGYALAGHNINSFDIPYLCKRYIINGIKVPDILNNLGKKPWEMETVDTIQMWRLGGGGNISLEVICAALNIKCKSTEITGKNMYQYDIKDIDWEELKKYCEEDTNASYEIYKIINNNL
jgi:DNA polymerase elongation subunit (family B)